MPASVVVAIVAAAFYGAALVFIKVGLRYMSPAAGALVSIPSTMAFYWVLAIFLLDVTGWVFAAALIFVAVGLFYPAVVTLLVYESNRRMGPTVAGSISSTTPLFAAGGAVLIVGESLTTFIALGTCAVVLGVMMLSITGRDAPRSWPRWSLLLPLGAAILRGAAQALTKVGLTLWANPFAAVLIGYTVSSVVLLGTHRARAGGRALEFRRRGIPWFMLAGASNGLALLATYYALEAGRVAIVSPLVAAYPVFTLALSALFLREEVINLRVVLGVALTITGVIIVVAGR